MTVEIPSVEKEDIYLDVADGTIEIAVDNTKRGKYHELLNLPCDVKPKTMKVTYKNGVLDVVIKRKKKKTE
ncbi:Hsp20/alpha crystallin family protein [Thermoplasmatota archaeon]